MCGCEIRHAADWRKHRPADGKITSGPHGSHNDNAPVPPTQTLFFLSFLSHFFVSVHKLTLSALLNLKHVQFVVYVYCKVCAFSLYKSSQSAFAVCRQSSQWDALSLACWYTILAQYVEYFIFLCSTHSIYYIMGCGT